MMEYQAVVKVGKKNISVNFSDGSMNAMGINPATFTTDNIIIQNAIESSSDFKRGRIHIVRTIDLAEELHVIRNQTKTEQTPIENESKHEAKDGVEWGATMQSNVNSNEDSSKELEGETPPMIQVEFSCNDDAKDYLEQNFGYVRSKLKNREDIVNAGKANGIEILFD